jgi:hypothetical protein
LIAPKEMDERNALSGEKDFIGYSIVAHPSSVVLSIYIMASNSSIFCNHVNSVLAQLHRSRFLIPYGSPKFFQVAGENKQDVCFSEYRTGMSCMSDPSQSGKTEETRCSEAATSARHCGVMVLRTFGETKVRRPPGRDPALKILRAEPVNTNKNARYAGVLH